MLEKVASRFAVEVNSAPDQPARKCRLFVLTHDVAAGGRTLAGGVFLKGNAVIEQLGQPSAASMASHRPITTLPPRVARKSDVPPAAVRAQRGRVFPRCWRSATSQLVR